MFVWWYKRVILGVNTRTRLLSVILQPCLFTLRMPDPVTHIDLGYLGCGWQPGAMGTLRRKHLFCWAEGVVAR